MGTHSILCSSSPVFITTAQIIQVAKVKGMVIMYPVKYLPQILEDAMKKTLLPCKSAKLPGPFHENIKESFKHFCCLTFAKEQHEIDPL